MGKELNQAIMVRSKLRNKYLESKSWVDKQKYNLNMRLKKQKFNESPDSS